MFQEDGDEDSFHGPGVAHVDSGVGVEFGPVEEAVKGLLVLFAQMFAESFPVSPLLFQNKTVRHYCPAHIFLPMAW